MFKDRALHGDNIIQLNTLTLSEIKKNIYRSYVQNLSFTVISDIYRSFIPNKTTYTK